jgi:hypothetical protein
MKAIVLLALVTLTACAGTSPATSTSVQPAASASPSIAPSPPPTPSLSATPDVTESSLGLSLTCRLPVTWLVNQNNQEITKTGFVTFPGQTLVEEATPAGSVFYDRAFAKWLPVWRNSVSPDGTRYAYSKLAGNAYQNTGSALHVVSVATGADRVIYSGTGAYSVVDFETEGVYLTAAVPEGYPRGLWLQSLTGGQPRLISSTIVAPAIGGGAAWGLDFNQADPSPAPGGLEGPMNRILRYDLRSGTVTPWFYRPGASLYVVGFDASGLPLVTASVGPSSTDPAGLQATEVWLLTSSVGAKRFFSATDLQSPSRVAAVDSHGVWFDAQYYSPSVSSIWLYTAGSIQVVAVVNRGDVAVAGGCIP